MATDTKVSTARLLFDCAEQMGLQPTWIIEGVLFVVITPDGEKYVHLSRSTLNSEMSMSLAKNKYLTRIILGRHGFPNIPFGAPKTLSEANVFLERHKKIIVKPMHGLGAQDIHVVTTSEELNELRFKGYIFEKYIRGIELRYLVLNHKVIAVHQSSYGDSVEHERMLERISFPADQWDNNLARMAVDIAAVFGLEFAAVDYLVDDEGKTFVLEVNTRPGLKWFHAPSQGPIVDVAHLFLQTMFDEVDNSPKALVNNA